MVISPFTTPHLSIPALESGLLRRPVVISDDGYAKEMVVDGGTGLTVPAGNVKAFADAINRLLSNQALRQKMGDAGFVHVAKSFDCKISLEKLVDVHDK